MLSRKTTKEKFTLILFYHFFLQHFFIQITKLFFLATTQVVSIKKGRKKNNNLRLFLLPENIFLCCLTATVDFTKIDEFLHN